MIPITAIPTESLHTSLVQRVIDEAGYVLAVLYRMRDEVYANPNLFDPDAQERIDKAIARLQGVLRSTRSEMMTGREVQAVKVALASSRVA